jgi:2-oxoisovalerate dehydrogenase E1 component
MRGHEEASGTKYVPKELFDLWGRKDPVNNFEKFLINEAVLTEDMIEAFRSEIKKEIDAGLEIAFAETLPTSKYNKRIKRSL